MTTKPTPLLYFAYASNLNKKQMKERAPESKARVTATLPNYRLVFAGWSRQWHGGTATIRAARGEKVLGGVYQVSERDLRRLDTHEVGYTHINVTVFDEDGTAIPAVTYIKSGQTEETKPSPEYLAVIQQGYRDWGIV